MKYIFQYPDFHGLDGDMLDAGPVAELAVTAERSGWNGFAFTEHPAPTAKWLETVLGHPVASSLSKAGSFPPHHI